MNPFGGFFGFFSSLCGDELWVFAFAGFLGVWGSGEMEVRVFVSIACSYYYASAL